jgi:hypothetical protein
MNKITNASFALFPAQRSDLFHDEFEASIGRVPLVVSRRLRRS